MKAVLMQLGLPEEIKEEVLHREQKGLRRTRCTLHEGESTVKNISYRDVLQTTLKIEQL